MRKLPPHLVVIGVFVLLFGVLMVSVMIRGNSSFFTPLRMPITLADSEMFSSVVRVNESNRYHIELRVEAPPRFGGPWLSKPKPKVQRALLLGAAGRWCFDSVELMMESIDVRGSLVCEDGAANDTVQTQHSIFGGRGGSDTSNLTSYFVSTDLIPLASGHSYNCTISISNVPKEFWGKPAELRLELGEPQHMDRMFEFSILFLKGLCGLIISGSVFVYFYLRWKKQNEELPAEDSELT